MIIDLDIFKIIYPTPTHNIILEHARRWLRLTCQPKLRLGHTIACASILMVSVFHERPTPHFNLALFEMTTVFYAKISK